MTLRFLAPLALLACACSSSDGGSPSAGVQGAPPGVKNVVVTHPTPTCTVTTEDAADDTVRDHIDVCAAVHYPHNPPMTGKHYPIWADYRIYDQPVPWGFLVHSLEHGAVVLAYNTDDPSVPAALKDLYDTASVDVLCATLGRRARLVVVPDPDLDVTVAASAWGSHYKATCLDEASLRAFIDAHYGEGTGADVRGGRGPVRERLVPVTLKR